MLTVNLFFDFCCPKNQFHYNKQQKSDKISQFVIKYSEILENLAFFTDFYGEIEIFIKLVFLCQNFLNKNVFDYFLTSLFQFF